MKLSRRCFLSFAIGGAAGTALTPLPWKLTDDLSIWSQNWPWTPVPPDGEAAYVDSACTLCPGGCGISVRKIDERAVKIEGQQGHPLNDGGICMLGLSGLQLLYGPTRIQAPLKRVGERGQGKWQAISWQQAISDVAAKLADIRAKGKPQSVAALTTKEAGTVPQLLSRLLSAYGSPNFIRMPSVEDAYEAALYLTQGATGSAGLDVENADFILSFGSAILDGYGSPVRMFRAHSGLQASHGKVVQIEPRLSNTAAKASVWLAAKPGSEAELALAMAHSIIDSGRYHAEFVTNYAEGFDAFARMVAEKYTPKAVAQVAGIDAKTIVDTALAFADAKKPLAILGRGKGQTPGSLKEALAVHALNALVGNINQPGGVQALPAHDYISWPEVQTDSVAAAGMQTARLDGAGADGFAHARFLVNRLIDAADGVQALLVAEANPCYSLPDAPAVKAAFDKIPFVVSFSSFMDETAMQADLILPNHLYLERYEDVPVTAGVSRPTIGLCQPVVEPTHRTQHLGDTIIQIARALKGSVAASFPWPNYQTCLEQTLASQWGILKNKGVWTDRTKAPSWDQGFDTPSGKFALMSDTVGAVYMTKAAPPAGDGDLLLIPYDSIRLASGYIGDSPFMVKTLADNVLKGQDGFVQVNPETAAKLGLADSQPVQLTTAIGQARVRVHLFEGVMPGVVAMPRGLGHSAYDQFLAGKGVNVNQLIGSVEDPASGLDAAYGIRATLAKA